MEPPSLRQRRSSKKKKKEDDKNAKNSKDLKAISSKIRREVEAQSPTIPSPLDFFWPNFRNLEEEKQEQRNQQDGMEFNVWLRSISRSDERPKTGVAHSSWFALDQEILMILFARVVERAYEAVGYLKRANSDSRPAMEYVW